MSKIRFKMKIKGCQWQDGENLLNCPYMRMSMSRGAVCMKSNESYYDREIPNSSNPAWCPLKENQQ